MCQFQITPEACQHVPMFKCPSSIKVLSHSPLTASQLWTRPSRATVTTKWASGENTANSNGMLPAPPHERVRKPLAMWQSDIILVHFLFSFLWCFGDDVCRCRLGRWFMIWDWEDRPNGNAGWVSLDNLGKCIGVMEG